MLKPLILALLTSVAATAIAQAADAPHNVILFVADGLRGPIVNDQTAPTMAAIAKQGVWMKNGHALFPTFTTANASAMATGHYLGDTGDFSNTIYSGFQVPAAGNAVTPFLENDVVLGQMDTQFGGNYLDESTILALARAKGFSTASIGKLGPVLIFDPTARDGQSTIVIDDATGTPNGIPLSDEVQAALKAAGLGLATPPRGANGKAGDMKTSGTTIANVVQQDFFAAAATRAVLPILAARGKPFVLVFWSRDPDGSQHNQGDSLGKLVPGINGPTSLAAIRNADDDLARLKAEVDELGLTGSTDIIVTADHGFSTISKASATSDAAKQSFPDTPAGLLPVGFVAHDISVALDMPLFDPDNSYASIGAGQHAKSGNAVIGADKDHPKVVVAANGGSDLVYLPDGDKAVAGKVIDALLEQDYVSGLFVDPKLGSFPGTLSLEDINFVGKALTPLPAIAINFKSFDTICGEPARCAVEVADSGLQQGQGMHGSFSRADTWNFMAAIGPDFKSGFVDLAPSSNADVGKTIVKLMGLDVMDKGKLIGRSLDEAMAGGAIPEVTHHVLMSAPAANGLATVVNVQQVGDTRYFDAAGFPGRSVGLSVTALPTD